MGMAPMTISPFAAWLVSHYDWRTAMAVIGVMAWVLLIPCSTAGETGACVKAGCTLGRCRSFAEQQLA